MELIKYANGSDADECTSVVAGGPDHAPVAGAFYWYYDRSERNCSGTLQISVRGLPKASGEPDSYELRMGAPEVGAILSAARPVDMEGVMTAFLGRADPEVLGVVVGRVVAHLARGRTAETDATQS